MAKAALDWVEQVGIYCSGLEALGPEVHAALVSIGHRQLMSAFTDLARVTRLMGADGKTDYSLALCGRAISPVTRAISKDAVVLCVFVFCCGPQSQDQISFFETVLWSARWHEMGMPTVRVSAQQVAALALTDIDKASVYELRAPWPAFAIALESDSFPIVLTDNRTAEHRAECDALNLEINETVLSGVHYAKRIAVLAFQGSPVLSASGILPNGTRERVEGFYSLRVDVQVSELWSGIVSMPEMCADLVAPWIGGDRPGFDVDPEPLETRAIAIAKQLTVNVLQAMLSHGIVKIKTNNKTKKPGSFALRSNKEYTLGAPVKVNAIPALHQYLTGRKDRAYKVRWIVRGHWRNQPCGPQFANVERKWIEPYWKGRANDPINIRDHVL